MSIDYGTDPSINKLELPLKELLKKFESIEIKPLRLKPSFLENIEILIPIIHSYIEDKCNFEEFEFLILFFYNFDKLPFTNSSKKDEFYFIQEKIKEIRKEYECFYKLLGEYKPVSNTNNLFDKYKLSYILFINNFVKINFNILQEDLLEELSNALFPIMGSILSAEEVQCIENINIYYEYCITSVINLMDNIRNGRDLEDEDEILGKLNDGLEGLDEVIKILQEHSSSFESRIQDIIIKICMALKLVKNNLIRIKIFYLFNQSIEHRRLSDHNKTKSLYTAILEALKIFNHSTFLNLSNYVNGKLCEFNNRINNQSLSSSYIIPSKRTYTIIIESDDEYISPSLSHEIYEVTNGDLYVTTNETFFNMAMNLIKLEGMEVIKPEEKKKLQITYMIRVVSQTIKQQKRIKTWIKGILSEFKISDGYYSSHSGDFIKLDKKTRLTFGENINKEFKVRIDNSIKRWRILSDFKNLISIDTEAVNNVLKELKGS